MDRKKTNQKSHVPSSTKKTVGFSRMTSPVMKCSLRDEIRFVTDSLRPAVLACLKLIRAGISGVLGIAGGFRGRLLMCQSVGLNV